MLTRRRETPCFWMLALTFNLPSGGDWDLCYIFQSGNGFLEFLFHILYVL